MKFYVPFRKDGSWGNIFPNPTKVEDFPVSYNPVMKVVVFIANTKMDVSAFLYSEHALWNKLGTSKKNKPHVLPPLLDIRASGKSFPAARKAVFCAMKKLSLHSEPFKPGALDEEEEYDDF